MHDSAVEQPGRRTESLVQCDHTSEPFCAMHGPYMRMVDSSHKGSARDPGHADRSHFLPSRDPGIGGSAEPQMRAEDLSTPYEEWAGAGERTRGRTVRQLSCCALLLILPSWLAFTSAATQPYAAPVLLRLKAMPVVPPTLRVPVVLMHGIGDSGSSDGMVSLCRSVEEAHPGTHVRCANVADGLASIGVSIGEQVEGFAALVQSDPLLADGFDAIGFSQGALVVRGYIERHNAPVVRRFVSVCGPAAGIGACPGHPIPAPLPVPSGTHARLARRTSLQLHTSPPCQPPVALSRRRCRSQRDSESRG